MARNDSEVEGGRQINPGLIAAAVVGVLLAVFIFQNTDDQTVSIFFWEVTAPLWVVLLGTALVALVITELASTIRRRRRR